MGGKHKRRIPKGTERYTDAEFRNETHMEIFARLAKVKNMHGAPGPRKPKRG